MTEPSSTTLLSKLTDHDRDRLGEALRRLVAHGSILGLEQGQSELYHWSYQNRDWIEEMAGLLDLRLHWEHESRIVQAVPQTGAFLLRLKLDATLVLLTLWYEFDTAVRDRGEPPPIQITVEQLNDSLRSKFEPLRKNMPSEGRLREILTLAQRKNLLRLTPDSPYARTRIEILPTLKRIIPFQEIAEWTRHAERYVATAAAPGSADDQQADEDEELT